MANSVVCLSAVELSMRRFQIGVKALPGFGTAGWPLNNQQKIGRCLDSE